MKPPKPLLGLLAIGLALATSVQAQSSLTNGLVAYYPFNGNANDAVSTNNGTVVNATLTTDRFGRANHAYLFHGMQSYIQCPDTGLPSGSNPRTVSLWMNIASFMDSNTYPFGYGANTPPSGFYAVVNSLYYSEPTIGLGMASNVETPRWGRALMNVWYHLAITYGGSTATLFLNGVDVGQAPRTYDTTLTGSFFIGGHMEAPLTTVSFSGTISDVRIYNRALTGAEVQQLYDLERPQAAARIYFTDIVSHDGTAAILRQVQADGSGMTDLLTGLQHPRGLALDVSGGKVYWAETGLRAIRRANLDGTGPIETVVSTGTGVAAMVALDLAAGKMYWATYGDPGVRRANLDGSAQETLVTVGLSMPTGIALDTVHGKLYWTDLEGNLNGTGSIHRSNLDGSNAETLLTGIDEASGIACDPTGGKIYWTEKATKKIQRANLNGTGVEDLVVGLDNPTTLALDLSAGKVYWTDSEWSGQANRITRANLDGSNPEIIVSGTGFPWGIAVDPGSGPRVSLLKAVKPTFDNLIVGTDYQLQVSGDLTTWTNQGSPFTATNSSMVHPQYWDVDNWDSLYFQLQVVP